MTTPSVAQQAAAVRQGARVLFGRPVSVPLPGGFALLNLAEAARSHPDPWLVSERGAGGLIHQTTASDAGWSFDGFDFPPDCWGLLMTALDAMPHDSARHDPNADAARARAGAIAMKIENNMARARLLDALDGWGAVAGELVDEGPEGRLYTAADPEMRARLLRVICPSTGRAYFLCVPREMETAAAARRWTLGLPADASAPDVET